MWPWVLSHRGDGVVIADTTILTTGDDQYLAGLGTHQGGPLLECPDLTDFLGGSPSADRYRICGLLDVKPSESAGPVPGKSIWS